MSRNENMVCLGLRNSRSYNADTDFRYQLDRNTRSGIRALEIVNELLGILNRVDIVMGGGEISPTPGVE